MIGHTAKQYAALALLVLGTQCIAAPPQILSMKLGISMERAVSIAGPGFVRYTTTSPDEVYTITYLYKETPGAPKEYWTLEAVKGKISYISHKVDYTETSIGPQFDKLKQQLKSQYGSAVTTSLSADGAMIWAWDRNTHPIDESTRINECGHGLRNETAVHFELSAGQPPITVEVPGAADPTANCSFLIFAVVQKAKDGQERNGGVASVEIKMMDNRRYLSR
jgi:hypothetical protein